MQNVYYQYVNVMNVVIEQSAGEAKLSLSSLGQGYGNLGSIALLWVIKHQFVRIYIKEYYQISNIRRKFYEEILRLSRTFIYHLINGMAV